MRDLIRVFFMVLMLFLVSSDEVYADDFDLYYIKTSNTGDGHVEVHIASAASNYQSRIVETSTTFGNENNGVWQLLPNRDLAYIKTSSTGDGRVEVHIASAASSYQTRILEVSTTFGAEYNGVFSIDTLSSSTVPYQRGTSVFFCVVDEFSTQAIRMGMQICRDWTRDVSGNISYGAPYSCGYCLK